MKAHNILGCKGVTRSILDFFRNKFYLLELNTQPGMTKLSLVPEIAAYKGIFNDLVEWMLLKMLVAKDKKDNLGLFLFSNFFISINIKF